MKPLAVRADELLTLSLSEIIARRPAGQMYNFEYYLNRPYAFNRDKGECRICGEILWSGIVHIHHINPSLPLSLINRVTNLASTGKTCHGKVHDKKDYSFLGKKAWNKIQHFREKLGTIA
jgi:5-methylcytosine-specific restriction endonuclease McrA